MTLIILASTEDVSLIYHYVLFRKSDKSFPHEIKV